MKDYGIWLNGVKKMIEFDFITIGIYAIIAVVILYMLDMYRN